MTARKPTSLKLVEGNRGKRKLPVNEPKPRPITPDLPEYLNETGQSKWKELVPELEVIGTLTIVDRDVLGRYCNAYQRLIEALEALSVEPVIVTRGTGGSMLNPWTMERNRAFDDMAKAGAELGIGAASRSRIEVSKPKQDTNPLAEIQASNSRR